MVWVKTSRSWGTTMVYVLKLRSNMDYFWLHSDFSSCSRDVLLPFQDPTPDTICISFLCCLSLPWSMTVSQSSLVSCPWQFCGVLVRYFSECPSIRVHLMCFLMTRLGLYSWKEYHRGSMLLEVGRKQILFADRNDSLERGRFNDVGVKEDHCQRNVFEQTRGNRV